MNHRILRVAWGAALAMGLAAGPAHAQLANNLSSLDPEQVKGYLDPFNEAFSAGLNGGVFRSGHVPTSGLNIAVDLKGTWFSFSDKDRTFATPDIPGYGSIEAPTVVGDIDAVTQQHATTGATLSYPGGLDMSNFATAIPQVSVGSIFGTRAIFRYLSLALGDNNEDLGDFELIGIGGQHSISQHLPGIPVDLAIGAMWQQFKIGTDTVESEALTFNLTGSRRYGRGLLRLEPYGQIGMDTYDMKVNYEIADESLEVKFDRINDAFFGVGANLSMAVIQLHAEYRRGAGNSFAGGLAVVIGS